MKKIFWGLAFVPALWYSQIKTDVEIFTYSNGKTIEARNSTSKSYDEFERSPYLDEDFNLADIEGYKTSYLLRYNAYEDEMEMIEKGVLKFVDRTKGLAVNFPGTKKKYVLKNYFDGTGTTDSFLVELVNGEYSLYKREKIGIVSYNNATNPYNKPQPSQFVKEKDAYFITFKNTFYKVPKKTTELKTLATEVFETNNASLDSFFSRHKFNITREEDLINFVQFLNK